MPHDTSLAHTDAFDLSCTKILIWSVGYNLSQPGCVLQCGMVHTPTANCNHHITLTANLAQSTTHQLLNRDQPPNFHPSQPTHAMDEPAPKQKRDSTINIFNIVPSSMPSATSSKANEPSNITLACLSPPLQLKTGISMSTLV